MSDARLALVMALAGGLIAGVVWLGRPTDREPAPTPPAERSVSRAAPNRSPLVGTASCSAAGCHGHPDPAPRAAGDPTPLLDEFTKWVSRDPHTKAYRVLREDERSLRIARNLGLEKPPHEEVRCLACHTDPRAADSKSSDPTAMAEMAWGVGCESCHGPAAQWLKPHQQSGWARNLTSRQAEKIDWRPLGDLEVRAETCVGCHVGAPADPTKGLPARDVDHDLIAAGHPRLNFELGSFLANLPPHWNHRQRHPAREVAPAWAVGHICSAEADLRLLAARAAGVPKRPWPEFAAYGCFACHHDLKEPSWRQQHGYGGRTPGALPFGTWYLPLARALAGQPGAGDPEARQLLDQVTMLMQRPYPDPKKVQEQAEAAANRLRQWRQEKRVKDYSAPDLRDLLKGLVDGKPEYPGWSWDGAEQLFLAAGALKAAEGDPDFAARHPDLTQERAFHGKFASPRDFEPEPFRARLQEALTPSRK